MIHAKVEQPVEIDRLMRPVEIADADMKDAGREVAAVVGRNRDACPAAATAWRAQVAGVISGIQGPVA